MRAIEILLVEGPGEDRLATFDAMTRKRLVNSVHVVDSCASALAYLKGQSQFPEVRRPDLIVLDWKPQEHAAVEFLRGVRADARLKAIPVVVLLPPDRDERAIEACACYASLHLAKPIDVGTFIHALTSLEKYWFEILTFPEAASAPPAHRSETPESNRGVSEQTLRLLLVEDNPADVLLFQDAVDRDGLFRASLTHVVRLRDAEAEVRSQSFDLIVTDLGLPDSSGIETFRQLQAAAPGLPIIVLTGNEDDAIGHEALRHGAQDYLVKGELSGRALARAARYAVDKKSYQQRLQQASRLEAVGRLTAGVAHDFNNILAVIRGNAELLTLAESPEVVEGATDIRKAADRGVALARQLLSFSRQRAMTRTALDLNELIHKFAPTLKRLLGGPVEVALALAPELPLISADAGMLEQVLLNLAVNARDAMPSGGTLRITTTAIEFAPGSDFSHPGAYPGKFASVAITDTGTGMSPTVLEHLFDPFFTTKPFGAGSGLGLATVHGIVQQHRGWVEVSSQIGAGSTFQIFLPVANAVVEKAQAPVESTKGGIETILFIEDEASLRMLVAKHMTLHGYKVLDAADAREALRHWAEQKSEIDLVLSDITLPDGENGMALAESFLAERPDLPVVLTSGYSADLTSGAVALEEGVNFLQKPYELGRVLLTVRQRLDAGRRRREEREREKGAAAHE